MLAVARRVRNAGLGEAPGAQAARVAARARAPLRVGLVAGHGRRIVDAEPGTLVDDFRLRHRDQRRVHAEAVAFHAIAMTSLIADQPWLSGIYYWSPETLTVIQAVQRWRTEGVPVYFTLDAGPSVHLLCEAHHLNELLSAAAPIVSAIGAGTIISGPGRGAWVLDEDRISDATCQA